MRRFGKGGIDRRGVAVVKVERDIARHVVIDERRAVAGAGFGRGDDRQRLDVDRDGFGGVLCLRYGFSDDARHRIADIAHFADRKRLAARLAQRRTVTVGQRDNAFEGAVAFHFGAAVDGEHARHFTRRLHADRADRAVGDGTANHDHIGLAG